MSDIENKLRLINRMQNAAVRVTELDDVFQDMLGIITSRGWDTTGAPTDAELESLGIKAADVGAFVNFMTQHNLLMAGQPVTPMAGRRISDVIRVL